MKEVLTKTVKEAKDLISKKNVDSNICVTQKVVAQGLDILRGAVTIVYPMGLPPHDPIQAEFDNEEDLSGTQVHNNTKYSRFMSELARRWLCIWELRLKRSLYCIGSWFTKLFDRTRIFNSLMGWLCDNVAHLILCCYVFAHARPNQGLGLTNFMEVNNPYTS